MLNAIADLTSPIEEFPILNWQVISLGNIWKISLDNWDLLPATHGRFQREFPSKHGMNKRCFPSKKMWGLLHTNMRFHPSNSASAIKI
jgi:hypothetical protein